MMFVLATSIIISDASAQSRGLRREREARIAGDAGLQQQIDTIELTPGPQGETGATGDTGPQGLPGNDGLDGAVGAQGPAGNDGAVGAQGPAGNDGAVGAQGPAGNDGADGAQGSAGNDGAVGAQGPAGNDGAVGAQGPAGNDGAVGAQGPAGNDGADGDDGEDGLSIQGPQGDPGTSSWVDGFETVSTTGSVQIGSDTADGTTACNSANEGTIRFDTTTKIFEGCDGTAWGVLSLSPHIYAIGDTGPAGGVVFYITNGGQNGMEAATADQGSSVQWDCKYKEITGADGAAVGTGAQNTSDILAECSQVGKAAELADAYALGGYTDWFLPSIDELDLLYQQKAVVGGMGAKFYWSSTEYGRYSASALYMSTGEICGGCEKDLPFRVRAVRAF